MNSTKARPAQAPARTQATAQAQAPEKVPLRRWLGVGAVASGTFAMVTLEQLPVGLLSAVGSDLRVSEGVAGLMVTVPGLVASAAAPLLPVAIRRLDRRLVLIGLISLMVVANILTAIAPNFPTLLAARFLVGIGIGGFWAMAAGIAVRLVPSHAVPKATALTFGGATAANVLGVPAGTLIGSLTDWRVAFVAVAVLGLLIVGALAALLPSLPAGDPVRLRALGEQLRVPAVRTGILATFFLVSGNFAAFTFINPLLREVAGLPKNSVGGLLLLFGAAGIAGNFLAGMMLSRDILRTILTLSLTLAAVLALFPLVGANPVGGVALLVLWGLAFGGIPVSVQTWILRSAPDAAEAATALNTSLFNLAIALGALFGGLVVDHLALRGVLWLGAVLILGTSTAVYRARKH
ncbi:MFS transporter [Actinomadura oligospora]|uniref:MFS transporter n=1 Tax=Actinomadura oligospora TaxID=111804 RepID=UPI0004B34A57|nr:MFS transporter [Actinomadura oligospora]